MSEFIDHCVGLRWDAHGPGMGQMPRCLVAHCKKQYQGQDCPETTRLPLPNPEVAETYQINSPTASRPLLILCKKCSQISHYVSEDDLEEIVPAGIATAADIPFYCVDFVCGQPDCEAHTKVYMRHFAALPEGHAIAYARKALGLEAKCPKGHYLWDGKTHTNLRVIFRKIEEHD